MTTNVEFKAQKEDLSPIRKLALARGAHVLRHGLQTDTYFNVSRGRLKLRTHFEEDSQLIYYERLASPTARDSVFTLISLGTLGADLHHILSTALGVRVVVQKEREQLELGPALINLDVVDPLGRFVEIEVDVARAGNTAAARELAEELKAAFNIADAEIVPWSYSDLCIMHAVASSWRAKLAATEHPGTLFLLDGPSASGKTTLAHRLAADRDLALSFVPRYSTRDRRAAAAYEYEYHFVTADEFAQIVGSGGFLEYRDFLFGMSYGLAWEDVMTPLLTGRDALGIMNLGNVRHVRRVLPEAVTILVTASEDTLRRRLMARGHNTTEQIEERLQNAALVTAYQDNYHHVIVNDDGRLEQSFAALKEIIRSCRRAVREAQ